MNKATGAIVSFGQRRGVSSKTGKAFAIHNVTMSDGQVYEVGFNPLKGYSVGDNISFMWTLEYGKRQVQTATIMGAAASPGGGGYGYEDDTPATSPAPTPTAAPRASGGAYTGKGNYQPKVFPVPKDNGDRSICRQNALTNARELVTAMCGEGYFKGDLDVAADKIIQLAYKFEEFTTGDRELNAAKAEVSKAKKKVVDIRKDEPSVLEGLTGTDDEPFG